MRQLRRVLALTVGIVVLALPALAVNAADWNRITFDSFLTAATNPCDATTVPERTGTTSLGVAEIMRPSGQIKVIVHVELTVRAGEYVTRMRSTGTFNEVAEEYTFPAKSVTWRGGVREYVTFDSQTVFMSGDQPVGHAVFFGSSVCVRGGP